MYTHEKQILNDMLIPRSQEDQEQQKGNTREVVVIQDDEEMSDAMTATNNNRMLPPRVPRTESEYSGFSAHTDFTGSVSKNNHAVRLGEQRGARSAARKHNTLII